MSLSTFAPVTTIDDQKKLCVLLSLLLSSSSYSYQNSPQLFSKLLFNHFINGYSFSLAEVKKITRELEEQSLVWEQPFRQNHKLSIDAIVYAIVSLLEYCPGLIKSFLTQITTIYRFNDSALMFMFELFNSIEKSEGSPLASSAEPEIDHHFINLLAQSKYSKQLWLALPAQWQQICLEHFIRGEFFNLTAEHSWPSIVQNTATTIEPSKRIYLNESLATLLQQPDYNELLIDKSHSNLVIFSQANSLAIDGTHLELALQQFKTGLTLYRKTFVKGSYPCEISGLLYMVCLYASGTEADLKQLKTHKNWYNKQLGELSSTTQAIEFLLLAPEKVISFEQRLLHDTIANLQANPNALAPLFCLLLALIKHGSEEQINALRDNSKLLSQLIHSSQQHQHWLGEQCTHLANWLTHDTPLPDTGLLQHFKRVPQWQRWLNEVSKIDTPTQNERLVWQLDLTHLDLPLIQAKVQKHNSKGEWTKGRKVNIYDLDDAQYRHLLSPADHNLVQVISNHAGFGYSEVQATSAVLQALINFKGLEDIKGNLVTLNKGEFIIEIGQNINDCYQLIIQPKITDIDGDFLLTHSHANSYQVFVVDDKQHKLNSLLAQQPNNLTEEKLPQLNAALEALSEDHYISSSRSEFSAVNNVRQGLVDLAAVIKLTPMGIDVNFYTMPFGVDGPWVEPAIGAITLAYSDNEQADNSVVKRDLKAEKRALKNLLSNLAGVFADQEHPQYNSAHQQFYLPEDISQAIIQLEAAQKDNALVLSWDENAQGMKVANSKHLSLNLNDDNDWLSVSGKLSLPDGQIIALQTLLKAPRRGSIIEFDENNSLLLDQRLTNLLNRLEGMQSKTKNAPDDQLRIANARALPLYHSAAELSDVSFGANWQQRLAKFERPSEPVLPAHLVNILRDYQVVGVKWLMQLANWGLNACLADDMGLGKTLQTLNVLQMRSALGASLVIAPKSVCHNWQVEAARFTPTLNIKTIDNAAATDEVLAGATANDLVIVSYGLLPLIGDQLAAYEFANIVLDEAQAIKNPLSLRAKAAFALNGQFKVALSGTPIENHLGELWSLFNFLMPGFLHSLAEFKKRFGNADKNQQQADTLKTLIAPFILRRNKKTVLTELPDKTEINLTFALSDKEQALYEATRLNALEQASQEDSQYITILASLTKLRRACIAPQLLIENSKLPSSKLDTAEAIIEELLENDHQALIFSQFVDVLKLVEQRLKKRGIAYCYLDGSMSSNKRKQQVDKFQAGEAPLFLISLKAGGTGLNLTAADYVLHLDPWWNPAVEQQASDRAHRLGQTRPVTVYRLIAQNTIEEKILQLHEHKQALADKVLSGSSNTGQLSKDQLLSLLQNQ